MPSHQGAAQAFTPSPGSSQGHARRWCHFCLGGWRMAVSLAHPCHPLLPSVLLFGASLPRLSTDLQDHKSLALERSANHAAPLSPGPVVGMGIGHTWVGDSEHRAVCRLGILTCCSNPFGELRPFIQVPALSLTVWH